MSRPSERPAASTAHDGAREREPGPSATRRRPEAALLFWPLGPGSRFARPGHDGRVGVNQLRGSSLQSSGIPLHPAAPLRRPRRSFLFQVLPQRGGGGAPTGALFCYVARARRDDRVSETRAVPLQPGRPLGAPSWRFSAGDPCCRLRQWHRSRLATCPHQAIQPDGRGPGPPALRFAPQSRDATPRSIVRIVSGGRPL